MRWLVNTSITSMDSILGLLDTQVLFPHRSMTLMVLLTIQQVILNSSYFIIEIFFAALEKKYYRCWLKEETALPMMYIDDCIRETVK